MSNAELKLEIFRLIDQQGDQTLKEIYQLLRHKNTTPLVQSYQEMAVDQQRETEALEWIENLMDSNTTKNNEE